MMDFHPVSSSTSVILLVCNRYTPFRNVRYGIVKYYDQRLFKQRFNIQEFLCCTYIDSL